jgi:hypothetical protein
MPAIARFGQLHEKNGVLVVELNSLAQPDSGEKDPVNPLARTDGLVIYGPPSTSVQWLEWFHRSREVIQAIGLEHLDDDEDTVTYYVFTHRPLVAAARFVAKNGDRPLAEGEKLDSLDPTLLPYLVFEDLGDEWLEVAIDNK